VSLETDVRRLSAVRPFDALPREAAQLIAFSCQRRALKEGQRLFSAGDPAHEAFFVLEGEIVLHKDEKTIRAAAGALIGQAALLAETVRPADATAAADSLLLTVPAETFRRVLAEFPQSAEAIRRDATKRARALIGGMERLRRRAFAAKA
jgi:CRP-like cAMP-binding protein